MSTRSHRVARLVLLDDTGLDAAGWGGRSSDGDIALLDADVAAERGLEESDPARAEPESSIWWDVFAFFMEGFALYGAALHPIAAAPVRTMLVAEKNRPPRGHDREPPLLALDRACDGGESFGIVVPLARVRPLAAEPEYRWTWLRSLGETLMELSSHVRREREIKQAVAALMRLDDRTLRDLGIGGRSDIERMVRYCRDC